VDPTLRREFLRWGGAAALCGFLAERLREEADFLHAAVDTGTVSGERVLYFDQLAEALAVQAVRVPPAELLEVSLDNIQSIRRLLSQRQRTAHQTSLLRSGARVSTVIGEILFNQGHFVAAGRWYQVAQRTALDAGDQYHADIALAGEAYLPYYGGRPQEVIDLVMPRLSRKHTPSPAIAWLWAAVARAQAAMGSTDFYRSIDRSRAALETSPEETIRPGILSFVPEKLAFYEASGCVQLRDATRSTAAAQHALGLYDPAETTEPALVRFEHASALALTGEVEEAAHVAAAAITDPVTFHGLTVRTRAGAFDQLLASAARNTTAAGEWSETYAALTAAQPSETGFQEPLS
jgi:hypothetical protein